MPTPPKPLNVFSSLVQVVADLRGPDGCPWDKEQNHESLTRYLIEESYEYIEAVTNKNTEEMKSELGDVLLQVILNAQISKENGHFDIADVISAINEKMIRRHPHVYSHIDVKDSDEVLLNWDEIKKKEKKTQPQKENTFNIPTGLSPLIKSLKLGEKAAKQKFDWDNPKQIIEKIKEETAEIEQAIAQNNPAEISNEIGDLLFATTQLARKLKINPENAIQSTNSRFEKRFFLMKKLITADLKILNELSLTEMETYWQKAKKELQ